MRLEFFDFWLGTFFLKKTQHNFIIVWPISALS